MSISLNNRKIKPKKSNLEGIKETIGQIDSISKSGDLSSETNLFAQET